MAETSNRFYKRHKTDVIWWLNVDAPGIWEFTFDKKHIYNMFSDYPWKLTPEQKEIFDRENPQWAMFFADRSEQ